MTKPRPLRPLRTHPLDLSPLQARILMNPIHLALETTRLLRGVFCAKRTHPLHPLCPHPLDLFPVQARLLMRFFQGHGAPLCM